MNICFKALIQTSMWENVCGSGSNQQSRKQEKAKEFEEEGKPQKAVKSTAVS